MDAAKKDFQDISTLGWAEKHKNGIFICAQADSVDIHKTEHYPTLGFCLKFKVKWAFAKISFFSSAL